MRNVNWAWDVAKVGADKQVSDRNPSRKIGKENGRTLHEIMVPDGGPIIIVIYK